MSEPELLQPFCDWVARTIDGEGVYPFPAMSRLRDSSKIEIAALALEPLEVIDHVWNQITCEEATEVIFGLDRSTRPGQGTEFADVLTCAHWFRGFHDSWNAAWRLFVINYQHHPRLVREPDYENEFWNGQIMEELLSRCPSMRIRTTRAGDEEAPKEDTP